VTGKNAKEKRRDKLQSASPSTTRTGWQVPEKLQNIYSVDKLDM
jgi:hypothetical protein